MSCNTIVWNNGTNQHDIDHNAPHNDREMTLKICFHSTMWIVVRPLMQVMCVVDSITVERALSVNSINGTNWRLVRNQWQNSRCMALSPGCQFCICCEWNGYKPSSCSVRHTCIRETPKCLESLHVLVVGLCYHFKNVFLFLHVVDVLVQMKHEHWETYHVHTVYRSPWKSLYDLQFSTQKTVNGILQQQQWHYHHRSHKCTAYQHIRHLWRCAAFFTTLLQYHYQQSQPPTDTSHQFTCFWQWHSMAGGKDNTGRQIQTIIQWNSSI
jgi:hypothetical protein